jgi:hypothetical protein
VIQAQVDILLGELGHATLHKFSLDDFEAAIRDRSVIPRWVSIGDQLVFYGIFSKIRAVFHIASHFCWHGCARAKWISQHPTLAEHTRHVRNCAVTNTNTNGLDQNVEGPCGR